MKKIFHFVLVAAVIMAFGSPAMAARISVGAPVPADVSFTTLDGKTVMSGDFMGSAESPAKDSTIFVLFNTACSQCRTELSYLSKLNAKGGSDINIVGIGIDMGGIARLERFAKKNRLNFPIVADPDFVFGSKVGLTMTPSSLIADKYGNTEMVGSGWNAGIRDKFDSMFK